jgi:DNA modification methylase
MILSTPDYIFYSSELPKLGFEVQPYPLIWHKPNQLGYGIMKPWQFKRDYEPILLAAKGRPTRTRGTDCSSIFTFDNIHNSHRIHPHEKPIEFINTLLKELSFPGGKILEPFAGSGVTLEACKKLDRRFVGIERDKNFFDKIQERLK